MAQWIAPQDAKRLHVKELDLIVLFWMKVGGHVIRLSSANGDFEAPADPLDPADHPIYSGAGELQNLPELSELINGESDRIDFMLSGVSAKSAALADEASEDIEGSEIRIGIVVLGVDLQPVTALLWLWYGAADVITPDYNGLEDPPSYSLTLEAATLSRTRRRNGIIYYSAAQQRLRSPSDAGCDRVTVFVSGHRLPWPKF